MKIGNGFEADRRKQEKFILLAEQFRNGEDPKDVKLVHSLGRFLAVEG